MANRLSFIYVFAPEQGKNFDPLIDPCAWVLCDDDRNIQRQGRSTLSNLQADALEEDTDRTSVAVIGVIPDTEIFYTRVEIPGRSEARVRQAAPFAIEPFLTSDLDEMHVAVWDLKSEQGVATIAINREELARYRESFELTGLFVSMITTLSQIKPTDTNSIDAWLYGNRLTIVLDNQMASFDFSIAFETLKTLFGSRNSDDELRLLLHTDDRADQNVSEVLRLEGIETEVLETSLAAYVAEHVDERTSLNLLQGEFEPTRDWSIAAKKWMQTYAVVLITGLVCALVFSAEGLWARSEASRLRSESIQLFESQFGAYQGLDNPAYYLQKTSPNASGAGDSFGNFLTLISRHFHNIELKELRYVESNQTFFLEIVSQDFETQERFKDALAEEGVEVEFASVEQRGNQFLTSVRISG